MKGRLSHLLEILGGIYSILIKLHAWKPSVPCWHKNKEALHQKWMNIYFSKQLKKISEVLMVRITHNTATSTFRTDEHCYISIRLHGILFQKTVILILMRLTKCLSHLCSRTSGTISVMFGCHLQGQFK